jgi:hypothetical protein
MIRVRQAASSILLLASLCLWPAFIYLYFGANDGPADASGVFQAVAYAGFLVFPVMGTLILTFRPQNTEGLVFSFAGFAWLLDATANEYGTYGLITDPGGVPAAEYAAWLVDWLWVLLMAPLTTYALLLFPTGHLPGRRWAIVAWLAAAGIVLTSVGAALGPGEIEAFGTGVVENPLGIAGLDGLLLAMVVVGMVALVAAAVASAGSLFFRLRRSEGVERLQMRWFVYAAALAATGVLVTIGGFAISSEVGEKAAYALLSLFGLPIAAAAAILRYRLYDIDLIINRTIVYASLTAVLAGLYSASITLFRFVIEAVAGGSSQATVVLTTLVLAAMFTPVKNRLQEAVDRYVGPVREPRKDLAKFTDELRLVIRALDPEATLREFAGHARRVANASGASVYLRRNGSDEPLFTEGVLAGGWQARVPLVARGEEVGWLRLVGNGTTGGLNVEDQAALEAGGSVVAEVLPLGRGPDRAWWEAPTPAVPAATVPVATGDDA